MKLQFKNQDFQTDAVSSIVEIFKGQDIKHNTFSISQDMQMSLIQNEFGTGNLLNIADEQIISNMNEIQKKNMLPTTDDLQNNQFCVEMETGTGKTYVYTKTIFELNKQYGFVKFIIVVPSVAIREGVYKSFEITDEHFSNHYDNLPYRYFIYNSAKLSEVRRFATSTNIEVMIINIDAFKKSENIINQAQDKLNGETAMKYIQNTNPIVIIDEPQSVDNTEKAKEAIASLNPLCVLRYSATHKEKINTLYRLTPVDAYQMGLVKQIAVSSNAVENDFNKPYIRLLSVSNKNGFSAKIEMDVSGKDGKVSRKQITVKPDADLYMLSGERELYDGYVISGIDCTEGFESIEFDNTETIKLGKAIGSIDENEIKKAQIKRTIEKHLEKELRFYEKGIKVLSLFFIDEVKKYRDYDKEDNKGIYAEMFEECYEELISSPRFEELKNKFPHPVDKVHDGYFSQDKKGNFKNTKGDTIDDYSTYNTIMKDKEWLLSFNCPLRFIWSHSALKEGWDNPNVFQVCTLIEQKSAFTCRQKVGRGLRLCVDQNGERIEDKNVNILHVMANESFAEFADTLQKEIETETGIKFGTLQISLFANMVYKDKVITEKTITTDEAKEIVTHLENKGFISNDGNIKPELKKAVETGKLELPEKLEAARDAVIKAVTKATETASESKQLNTEILTNIAYTEVKTVEKTVTYDDAKDLINHFENKGYITSSGKIKDTMKNALANGTLDLPQKYENARERFEQIIKKSDSRPPLRDASKDVVVRLKKQVFDSPEFLELWNKIKQKTAYRVTIDNEKFIGDCIKQIKEMPKLPKARIVTRTANINVQSAGITHTETEMRTTDIKDNENKLPDILLTLKNECGIPLRMCHKIIMESGRLEDFMNNPQLFSENCIEIINNTLYQTRIDGIRYIKLDGEKYYLQEIFDSAELMANLDKNAVAVNRSVYDHVIYDSETVERPFAVALDNDPDVKMFFKIPEKFKINTPLGTYNPDWAVYLNKDGVEKLYFVLETKGSVNLLDLRGKEQMKIHCGKEHFKCLDEDVEFQVAKEWRSLKKNLN